MCHCGLAPMCPASMPGPTPPLPLTGLVRVCTCFRRHVSVPLPRDCAAVAVDTAVATRGSSDAGPLVSVGLRCALRVGTYVHSCCHAFSACWVFLNAFLLLQIRHSATALLRPTVHATPRPRVPATPQRCASHSGWRSKRYCLGYSCCDLGGQPLSVLCMRMRLIEGL